MSFQLYNGVVQTGANSCGAFAIAAAMSKVRTLPLRRLDVNNLAQEYVVTPAGAAVAFAQELYQVTGCLNLPPLATSATYRYQNPVSDMNPPSALAYVAWTMGIPIGHIYVKYNNQAQGVFSQIQVTNQGNQGDLLATEINLIGGVYGNVVGPTDYDALPVAGETHLLLVNNYDHWVALSHNEVYDPATGFVGAYTTSPVHVGPQAPLQQILYNNGAARTLPFCGIWITLS